jgi:hypothetical protein
MMPSKPTVVINNFAHLRTCGAQLLEWQRDRTASQERGTFEAALAKESNASAQFEKGRRL